MIESRDFEDLFALLTDHEDLRVLRLPKGD